jgi:sarcosine oxidase
VNSFEYDVVVAGLGVRGSASVWQMARRGVRVLGLDRYAPPHALGSAHGETRVIREVYFEDPRYVPRVRRAWAHWESLERATGRTLLRPTGLVTSGPASGSIVPATIASAAAHGMACESLDPATAHDRFPALTPTADMVALYEPRAGVLYAERCVQALLDTATENGATIRFDTRVTGWEVDGDDGVSVVTDAGIVHARRLVLATGPWINELMGGALPLRVTRQAFHWFEPTTEDGRLSIEQCPVTFWEFEPGRFLYTLPDAGRGFKAALHHEGAETAAGTVAREVSREEREFVRALLARLIPTAAGESRGDAVCLYSTTPDENFIIDFHPSSRRVVVASPCSGHGFKFAPVVGEAVTDLAMSGTTSLDIGAFRLSRFG